MFEIRRDRLGRNLHCPVCRTRLTARPLAVERRLASSPPRSAAGAELPRLPLVVLVDNVRSLWNVGSIFRTADACGVRRVVLAGITAHPPRAEITKTALGADRAVAWCHRADAGEALRGIVADGYVPAAVETTPRAVLLDDVDWPERTCLVLGNEVAGISPAVLEACPLHVRIPMRGVKDSLNVAVAFGIAAHAAARALAGRAAAAASGGAAS